MDIILYIGLAQSLFATFLMLTKKDRQISDIVITVWLFLIALQLFFTLISINNARLDYTALIMFKLIPFTYGPFMFIYAKMLILEKPVFRIRYWFHFIPFVIVTVAFYFLASTEEIKEEIKNSFLGGELLAFHKAYAILIIFSIIFYVIQILYLIYRHERNVYNYFSFDSHKTNLRWLKTIAIIFAGAYSLAVISRFFNFFLDIKNPVLKPDIFPAAGLTLFAYALSFFGFNQERIFVSQSFIRLNRRRDRLNAANTEEALIGHKYERSGLKEDEAKLYATRITEFMESKKAYLDGNLTIENLSRELKIPKHYLTQVINENLNKNFYTFVNEYRVEEVKKKLLDPDCQNLTLLSIAYDAGFNSKTAFNTIFKKLTGLTPTQYKQESLDKN